MDVTDGTGKQLMETGDTLVGKRKNKNHQILIFLLFL